MNASALYAPIWSINRRCIQHLATLLLLSLVSASAIHAADPDPELQSWKNAKVTAVTTHTDRHVIHAYFNTSPESPDGRHVLYYTSDTTNGESGDLRILERSSGKETIIAPNITTEDAHRAACQQWSQGGKAVVYHNYRDGRWTVLAYDLATGKEKVLAEDRQLGFGAPRGSWIPVYGCHWNPGPHRDLELVHVETGERRTPVRVADVVQAYGTWMDRTFASRDVSIFFPVISPDEKRVFFKLALPSGGNDFRSSRASKREGKVIANLQTGELIRLVERWGHPSWSPDSSKIFEAGNYTQDVITNQTQRFAPSCFSDHPSIAPDGKLFVTDADVTKRPFGKPGHWAIGVGSMSEDAFEVLHLFDNAKGARSWRHNHPHPAFSADGKRIYFNTNASPWTQLMVAEIP